MALQDERSNQDDSDSEIDEIEPRLKYVRMQNDLKNILQNDAASCIAVHPKVRIFHVPPIIIPRYIDSENQL